MPRAASAPRGLARLERWFQAEVLRPHLSGKRRGAPAAARLLPSRTLAAQERLAIYQRGYMLRLQECMQGDFVAVRRVAGEKRFAALVRAYLERHPSRHYSLNPLGRHFARFLEREAPRVPRRALLAELARLEWAMQTVFEARPSGTLEAGTLARLSPQEWNALRFVPIEALELLAFEHRANAIVSAARRGEELPPHGRKRSFVAVYRKDWVVWRMDLDALQFELLASLCRGRTLGQALARAARAHRGPAAELEGRIQSACASFLAEGFFQSVR